MLKQQEHDLQSSNRNKKIKLKALIHAKLTENIVHSFQER